MTFSPKQIIELKAHLDALGLKYTTQDINNVAYRIMKFVLASEVRKSSLIEPKGSDQNEY